MPTKYHDKCIPPDPSKKTPPPPPPPAIEPKKRDSLLDGLNLGTGCNCAIIAHALRSNSNIDVDSNLPRKRIKPAHTCNNDSTSEDPSKK